MAKKTLKIALVGVGAAAQINHLPVLKKLEGVEVVALCDRDPEKAARVTAKAEGFFLPLSRQEGEGLRQWARDLLGQD